MGLAATDWSLMEERALPGFHSKAKADAAAAAEGARRVHNEGDGLLASIDDLLDETPPNA